MISTITSATMAMRRHNSQRHFLGLLCSVFMSFFSSDRTAGERWWYSKDPIIQGDFRQYGQMMQASLNIHQG
jgi:hypothetical protein